MRCMLAWERALAMASIGDGIIVVVVVDSPGGSLWRVEPALNILYLANIFSHLGKWVDR